MAALQQRAIDFPTMIGFLRSTGLHVIQNSEQIALANDAPETGEIVSLLQDLLNEIDALQLAIPAIKIAEAIDCLKKP